jgi:hypothetical protein
MLTMRLDKAEEMSRPRIMCLKGLALIFRSSAGLPDQNSGRFITEGRLESIDAVKARDALPLHGNVGGMDEITVSHPESQIEVESVSGVNPEC